MCQKVHEKQKAKPPPLGYRSIRSFQLRKLGSAL
uniref:Uncharacterized protein n=1 Tax=Rhizophora mucronata TaxID=61149 RepID=A0A2P2P7S4_RHIMU